MGMPTGLDLIGSNSALQEHWIKRVVAIFIDALLLGIVLFVLSIPFAIFAWGWFAWPFVWGVLFILYSTLLEATAGGATIGKKVMNLKVVAIDGPMTVEKALIRNLSKIHILFVILDWILGIVTQGDPRQRYLDRIARTTVTRVDANAYIEEQFRQMQYIPPHPTPPPAGAWGQPAPAQPGPSTQATMTPQGTPQQAPPAGGWPGQTPQAPGGGWPQHRWDESGQLMPQMKFCTACGGQLVQRGDGKLTCVRCGAIY